MLLRVGNAKTNHNVVQKFWLTMRVALMIQIGTGCENDLIVSPLELIAFNQRLIAAPVAIGYIGCRELPRDRTLLIGMQTVEFNTHATSRAAMA